MDEAGSSRRALRVEEVAVMLDIGRTSAYRLIRAGKIRHVRIGKLIRVPVDAVDEYLLLSGQRG